MSEQIGCKHEYLVNNGICNDESNYQECNYDGGECCGSHVNNEFCKECKCLNGPWGNGDGWGEDTTTEGYLFFLGFWEWTSSIGRKLGIPRGILSHV